MRNPSVSDDPHHSPFLLAPAANHTLRTYLNTFCPTKTIVFCPAHTRAASTAALKTYLLQHAAIRALLRPVYNLLTRATRLAHSITHSTDLNDLERAFRGDARTAYLWYTCLEDDEAGWFWSAVGSRTMKPTIRCPGCVVDRTLHTETTIRLMLAACCLAQIRAEEAPPCPSEPPSRSSSSDGNDQDDDDDYDDSTSDSSESSHSHSTMRRDAGLAEVARCWSSAVSESLSHDAFWRPAGIRAEALPRASVLAESMWCLEQACEEIEELLGGGLGFPWGAVGADNSCVESPMMEEYSPDRLLERRQAGQERAQRRGVVEAFVDEWIRQYGEPEELAFDVEIVGEDERDQGKADLLPRQNSSVALAKMPLVRVRSITS